MTPSHRARWWSRCPRPVHVLCMCVGGGGRCPLLLAFPSLAFPKHNLFCVSVYTLYMSFPISGRTAQLAQPFRLWNLLRPVRRAYLRLPARLVCQGGPARYYRPCSRWRGGSGAARSTLVPRPPGPPFPSRTCPCVCTGSGRFLFLCEVAPCLQRVASRDSESGC